MTEKAKFKYSAQEGILELEGSEDFVSKHFESLTDLIRIISRHVVVEQKQETQPIPSQPKNAEIVTGEQAQAQQNVTGGISDYPAFFSEINGKLKIVADLPGSNGKAKMTNAAILFCYGSKLLGDEQVATKDIRTVIEDHGCLDGPNFSKIFGDKTIFISDGVKGGNKDVKLTFQGEKKAKELLASVES